MKTKISTDGINSTIELIPENTLESKVIEAWDIYHVTVEVIKKVSPIAKSGDTPINSLELRLTHR